MATKIWKSTSDTTFALSTNWDGGTPVNNDTIVFNHIGTANLLTMTGAAALTGITLYVDMSYTGQIGSIAATGLPTRLTFGGGTIYLGRKTTQGSGPGPTLCLIGNTATTAMTITIYDSSSTGASTYYPPIMIAGGTNITLNQYGGNVGLCLMNATAGVAETATFATINVAASSQQGVPPQLTIGSGATVTALTANGGTIYDRADVTNTSSLINGNATMIVEGTGEHTTLESADAATVQYNGTGTITTGNLRGGTLNMSGDTRAKTITTLNAYRGSTIDIDNGEAGSITFTNAINYYDGMDTVTVITPPGVKGSLTNI